MIFFRSILFRACILASCAFPATNALAVRDTDIRVAEAASALKAYLRESGKDPELVGLLDIDACYPLAGRPAQDRLCLVRGVKKGDPNPPTAQEIGFRRRNGTWQMIDPETTLNPACPGSAEALHLLKLVVRQKIEKITSQPSEGVFSEHRGLMGESVGPLRLMCSYGLATASGELTAVAYLQYIDGAYAIDADVETLDD